MKNLLFIISILLTQITMASDSNKPKLICTVTDDPGTQLIKAKKAYQINDYIRLASSSSPLDAQLKLQLFLSNLNAFCQYQNSNTCYNKNNYKPANCQEISISLINPINQYPVLKTIF